MASRIATDTNATREAVCSTRVRAATFTTTTSRSLVRGSSRSHPPCAEVARSRISGDASAHEVLAQHLLPQPTSEEGGHEDDDEQSEQERR